MAQFVDGKFTVDLVCKRRWFFRPVFVSTQALARLGIIGERGINLLSGFLVRHAMRFEVR